MPPSVFTPFIGRRFSFLSPPEESEEADVWCKSVDVELASSITYNNEGATYENPLKSSCAVALGGIPGESKKV